MGQKPHGLHCWVSLMNKVRLRTWGFRCFLLGFAVIVLSLPLPGFIWAPGLWVKAERGDFVNFFLMPSVGFGLVIVSFLLMGLGSRRGDV